MAYITTHIRIALALKDKYEIQSMEKYLSGVVYPDSRYITGVDRKLTHDEKKLPAPDKYDDFTKGWDAHIKSDQAIDEIFFDLFPEYIKDGVGREFYIAISALKIILDISDYIKLDIMPYVKYLTHAFNPNGESLPVLEKYNDDIRNSYDKIKFLNPGDYRGVMELYDISVENIDEIISRAEKYSNKKDVVKIGKVTGLTIERLLNDD